MVEDAQIVTPEELLGELNETEKLYAPEKLYVRGRTELAKGIRVAVVGSRKASPDGVLRARRVAKLLCKRGITVVSGLAEGIDAAAHLGAIESGGNTIAVLGTSLVDVFPRQHRELQSKIGREHLLVTQFAPGVPIKRGNFPQRNRVMALMCDASIIVEAGDTSGSISQGYEALRLGRMLFIARSLVDRDDLEWPKTMIGYGAEVLDDPEQLNLSLPDGSSGSAEIAF